MPHRRWEASVANTITYQYESPSKLFPGTTPQLGLSTFTPPEQLTGRSPCFVEAFVVRPDVVAAARLAVATVAGSRYFEPWNSIAKRIRDSDPVVTFDGECLRFESFSACSGVHARLDIASDGLDIDHASTGTTNVDVNPPLRAALSSLAASDPLRLRVGSDRLEVDTMGGTLVEKQVPLPTRWVRGFGETQVVQRRSKQRLDVGAAAFRKLIQTMPTKSRGSLHVEQAGSGLRLGLRPGPRSVTLIGPDRLAAFKPLLRFAERLVVWSTETEPGMPTASVWELTLPSARLTLSVSPEPARGFSGEGGLLEALSAQDVDAAEMVELALGLRPVASVEDIAAGLGFDAASAARSVDMLAAAGRVGFDPGLGGSFHRLLPFGGVIDELNPRLLSSRALLDAGAVSFDGPDMSRCKVLSGDHHHVVQLAGQGAEGSTCTCATS